MIEVYDLIDDALFKVDYEAARTDGYFKAELYRTEDGRWRVGIITEQQYELKFEEQQS